MIEFRDVHKSFGDLEVLKGINLKIEKGQVVTLIGPSGSGKSTILRCMNLLERPTSGTVLIEGTDITEPKTQYEAAMSLGVSYRDMMKDIVLPQAVKHVLPSLVNEAIALLKESSILSYIGAVELLRAADQITVLTFRFFEPYLVIALIYYVMVMILSAVASRLERWVNRSDRVS